MWGAFWVVPTWLKGFFANITMRPGSPMDRSEGVVELFMEWLSFWVRLASGQH